MKVLLAVFVVITGFMTAPALSAAVEARIDISEQKMRVYRNGFLVHSWKVSTGRSGYRTPTGTYRPTRMYREYYSKKYDNAPMPYSVFFRGGYAVHGTGSIRQLGRPASHGCVRLHPDNAARLYSMIQSVGPRNAKIRIQH